MAINRLRAMTILVMLAAGCADRPIYLPDDRGDSATVDLGGSRVIDDLAGDDLATRDLATHDSASGDLATADLTPYVVSIALGEAGSLALFSDGTVTMRQTCDLESSSPRPTPIPLPAPARAVYADWSFLCAVGSDGHLTCHQRDQASLIADQFSALSGVTTLASSMLGSMYCWLGVDGLVSCCLDTCYGPSPAPLLTQATSAVELVGNYLEICALDQLGAVTCWENSSGPFSPAPVALPPIVHLEGSTNNTMCAYTATGTVYCWGDGIAIDDTFNVQPVEEPFLEGAVQIGVGQSHACALFADGSVSCWGYNSAGQMGNGVTTDWLGTDHYHPPTRVPGLSDIIELRVNFATSCALRRDGVVFCWGPPDDEMLCPQVFAPLAGLHPIPARWATPGIVDWTP